MSGCNIFLNYRREDTEGYARLIYKSLAARFPGHVFRDVTDIRPGEDFVKEIERKLETCQVLLVVIGKDWLTVKGQDGRRRLDDEQDFVRLEVATGLRRDIRVIPVLVEGARMPQPGELPDDLKPLARRNAVEIIDRPDDDDFKPLIRELERMFGAQPNVPPPPPGWPFWKKVGLAGALGAAAVLSVTFALSGQRRAAPPQPNPAANPGVNSPVSNSSPPAQKPDAPAAKPTPAAPDPEQQAAATATVTAPAQEPKAPPEREVADSFNPVGTWAVHQLANPDNGGTLTLNASYGYTAIGKFDGEAFSDEGAWQPGEGPLVLYLKPSDEAASYRMEILGGGGGVYRAKHDYFGHIGLRRVGPR